MRESRALVYAICALILLVVLWVSAEERKMKLWGTFAVLLAGIGAGVVYIARDGQGMMDALGNILFLGGILWWTWLKKNMKSTDDEEETI